MNTFNNSKNGVILMAVSAAKEIKEAAEFSRYTGIAPVKVLAVNPNKTELSKIYGREIEKEPSYVGTTKLADGTEVPQVRIDVIVETVADKYNTVEGIKNKITFFIAKSNRKSKAGKSQVVDIYGNFGWASDDEIANHSQLKSSTGKNLKISTNYRKAYQGEEELTAFIKTLYNLEAFDYKDGVFTLKADAEQNICRLDEVANYFSNNVKELKDTLVGCPNNIRVLFGVRKTDDGNLYQDIYNRKFMNAGYSNVAGMIDEIKSRKEAGALANTDFGAIELGLKEYTVDTEKFLASPEKPQTASEELPF